MKMLLPDPVGRAFSPPTPLADGIDVIRARYCILYEQFSHECY